MTVYPLEELLGLWAQEKLTPEQTIGQILQYLKVYQARLKSLEERCPSAAPDPTPPPPSMSPTETPPASVAAPRKIRKRRR